MCIFSGPVRHVRNTRIFAQLSGCGTQFLVYSMAYGTTQEVAMILPLPVGSRDENTAVRFITLEGYGEFFDDLMAGFPDPDLSGYIEGCYSLDSPDRAPLKVHSIGAFEASFVPALNDFDRLDARFRLPASVWDGLPQYREWGFVVFKLRVPSHPYGEEVHPMAFEFVTRLPDTLFFPTVHVHDGSVHDLDDFDHLLYYQAEHVTPPTTGYFFGGVPLRPDHLPRDRNKFGQISYLGSTRQAEEFMDLKRANGIVDAQQKCHALLVEGFLPNQDTLLAPDYRSAATAA